MSMGPDWTFTPEEIEDSAFDETSLLNVRPSNVNADGKLIYRVSGYEGFPAIYACRVTFRSAKVNR